MRNGGTSSLSERDQLRDALSVGTSPNWAKRSRSLMMKSAGYVHGGQGCPALRHRTETAAGLRVPILRERRLDRAGQAASGDRCSDVVPPPPSRGEPGHVVELRPGRSAPV